MGNFFFSFSIVSYLCIFQYFQWSGYRKTAEIFTQIQLHVAKINSFEISLSKSVEKNEKEKN